MFSKCILFNAKRLEKNLSKVAEEEFAAINLHHTYAYILTVISHYEIVKTKDIANTLSLDSSTVTRMVNKLIKDGYVIKGSTSSPVDISLTAKGQKLMPEISGAWERYHERCSKVLGTEQLANLFNMVEETNKLND